MLTLRESVMALLPPPAPAAAPAAGPPAQGAQGQRRRLRAVSYAALAGVCALALAVSRPAVMWALCKHPGDVKRRPLLPSLQAPSIWLPLQLVGCTAGAASMLLLPGVLACTMAGWRLRGALLLLPGGLLAAAGLASALLG